MLTQHLTKPKLTHSHQFTVHAKIEKDISQDCNLILHAHIQRLLSDENDMNTFPTPPTRAWPRTQCQWNLSLHKCAKLMEQHENRCSVVKRESNPNTERQTQCLCLNVAFLIFRNLKGSTAGSKNLAACLIQERRDRFSYRQSMINIVLHQNIMSLISVLFQASKGQMIKNRNGSASESTFTV